LDAGGGTPADKGGEIRVTSRPEDQLRKLSKVFNGLRREKDPTLSSVGLPGMGKEESERKGEKEWF